MGRSLTNAMINLGIDSEVEEALYEVSASKSATGSKGVLSSVQDMILNIIPPDEHFCAGMHLVTADLQLPQSHTYTFLLPCTYSFDPSPRVPDLEHIYEPE